MAVLDPDTEKRRAISMENRQELAIELLTLLNRNEEKTDVIREILLLIKEYAGFRAVGIRLKEGDDFPYYEANGFSSQFIKAETHLCSYNEKGEPVRDTSGRPVLDCVCGLVIQGLVDPAKDFFSENGSFWTNSTTKLLEDTTEEDFNTHIRGRCNTEGYESVALIPLKSEDDIIGLLQLNDRRRSMFTPEDIAFFEGIASSIGIAIKRRMIDDELVKTNIFLETILDNTYMLIAYMDAEFNFIKVNRTYAEKDERDPEFFIGKNHFDLYPDIDNEKIFRRVVKSGKPHIVYAKPFSYPENPERGVSYWDWSLIPIKDFKNRVTSLVLTLSDVTERIKLEKELTKFRTQLEKLVKERTLELKRTNIKLKEEVAEREKAEDARSTAYTELNQIFNTILLGIAIIDKDCNYIRYNKRFLDMFYLSDGDVQNSKCSDIWDDPRCGTGECPLSIITCGKRFVEFQRSKRIPGNREVVTIVNSVPYLSQNGEMKGIIQYYIDVTEKREVEREVLRISEEERQRIGNDLHDIIGQNLTAIAFLVEALDQKMTDEKYEGAHENIEQVNTLISNAISQTREITKMLRPVEMEKRGLKAALDTVASTTEELFNIPCRIFQSGNFIVSDINTASNLFYIAREAVNNAVKHAGPDKIDIDLISDNNGTIMIIRDNGQGYERLDDESGMGLKIMRYRANMIGAEFSAGNCDDGGFRVEVRLNK